MKPFKKYLMQRITLLVITALFFLNLQGQKIQFGIFADPVISWMSPDVKEVTNEGVRAGYNLGLSFNKFFSENYAFLSGISIHTTGGKLSYDSDVPFQIHESYDTLQTGSIMKYMMQYVEVPVGLKFTSNEIGYMTFFANLGLTGDVKIKARGSSSDNLIDNENIEEEIKMFNMTYFFGGGLEYSLGGNTALQFGVNYANGILDVTRRNQDKVILNHLAIRVGVIF